MPRRRPKGPLALVAAVPDDPYISKIDEMIRALATSREALVWAGQPQARAAAALRELRQALDIVAVQKSRGLDTATIGARVETLLHAYAQACLACVTRDNEERQVARWYGALVEPDPTIPEKRQMLEDNLRMAARRTPLAPQAFVESTLWKLFPDRVRFPSGPIPVTGDLRRDRLATLQARKEGAPTASALLLGLIEKALREMLARRPGRPRTGERKGTAHLERLLEHLGVPGSRDARKAKRRRDARRASKNK